MRSFGAKELAPFIEPMLLSFSDSMSIFCGTGVGRHLRLGRWSRFRALLLAAFLLVSVYAGLGATVARAAIPEPSEELQAPAAEPVAPADSQTASTDQSASSTASATQEQPINLVVSVRINSPGDDGPISQRNVVVGASDAANAASTAQGGSADEGAGAEGSADQDASTAQEAGSSATATQQGAQNIVVVVRINSPGDNGRISQENVDVAVSDAGNSSTTAQGGSGGTGGAATAPAAEAKRQHPPGKSARTRSRRPARDPAPVAPRKRQPAAGLASTPAATAPGPSYGSAAPSANPPRGVVRTAQVPASVRRNAKAAPRHAASGRVRTTIPQRLAGGAVDLLDTLAPPTRVAGRESSADVSGSVVYSLLAVLAAACAFLAWPYLSRLQVPGPRGWRG
jgi:hypothetical protein